MDLGLDGERSGRDGKSFGTTAAYEFQGPVQSVYATLAVRLAHSGSFVSQRSRMWRNAAIYAADVGGACGIYLRDTQVKAGRSSELRPAAESSANV